MHKNCGGFNFINFVVSMKIPIKQRTIHKIFYFTLELITKSSAVETNILYARNSYCKDMISFSINYRHTCM